MRGKNEFVVGVTIVLGLIVLGIAGFWLTGRPWMQQEREVVATFNRVGTLQGGAKVKYRGVTVGRVENIALSERGNGVFVTMTIAQDVVLPDEPAVLLSPESLFGDWQAEIVNQSEYPALQFAASTRPGVLPGAALPDISELTAVAARIAADIEVLSDRVQLAFTEETAVEIREAIGNVTEVTEQLGGFIDQQTDVYAQVGQSALASAQNIQAATSDVRETLAGEDLDLILANARRASANLATLSEQLQGAAAGVPGLVNRADATVASFGQTAEQVNALVADLRPGLSGVGATVTEARETLIQARSALATLEKSAALLGSGEGSFGRFLADPALYEETQRAITTLNRLLADVQANPAKYIGEVRVLP